MKEAASFIEAASLYNKAICFFNSSLRIHHLFHPGL